MKKIYFIFALGLLFVVSCKNDAKAPEKKSETPEATTLADNGYETFSGMFLYLENENAAVLQAAGGTMYGVVVDDQMHTLDKQCAQYKKNEHDMVPVVIKGIKKPNPIKDAWKEVIEVKQVLSVQRPADQDGTIIIKNNQ